MKLKTVWKRLRDEYYIAKCHYIKYYEQLPIDDKLILMESQHGQEMSGNIFYLLKYLSHNEKYADYQIYLCARKSKEKLFRRNLDRYGMEDVRITVLASEEQCRLMASAKYLFTDTAFSPYWIKKEGQIYLNTWHGTPLKTLGRKSQNDYHAMGNIQRNFAQADYLLYPNTYTKEHLIEDYMLSDIAMGKSIMSGYPRNEIFFDEQARKNVRERYRLEGKRVYAYMPTYRGTVANVGSLVNDSYLIYYLSEIERRLGEDELMYVNLHPLAKKNIPFHKLFHKIKAFPEELETYDFLNGVDCLVTDYSSVFFDFVNTGKKIVLFPYDKEEYLADRGMYFDMDNLPFPQVFDVEALLQELRTEKNYDDRAFRKEFCKYEGADASQKLCDYVILGRENGLDVEKIGSNGKDNILIYVGNLAANGITTSIRNLLNVVDLEQYNYYVSFITEKVGANRGAIRTLPDGVRYYATTGAMNLTVWERVIRELFRKKLIPTSYYMKRMQTRFEQEWRRNYGEIPFRTVIQFNGYEQDVILLWSTYHGKRAIYVHNDMENEITMKKNQRRDVLKYAYREYDRVCVVTQDIVESTARIAGRTDNIRVCLNVIDDRTILEKAENEMLFDAATKVYPSKEQMYQTLQSKDKKIITVGRFSPEKGHFRLLDAWKQVIEQGKTGYLFIMGGSSFGNYYEQTIAYIEKLGLENHVILLKSVSNPYPIIKACDGFVLSSFYEGFGLVLAEADILGKPLVCPDITGPRGFMKQYGGTLADNSTQGIREGILHLLQGDIVPLHVDYQAYNQKAVEQFRSVVED